MADKRSGARSKSLTWITTASMGMATLGLILSPLLGR